MTMITNLNKNLCKKDSRFKLVDDMGDGYREYSYTSPESGKAVLLSTHRTGGMTYLSICIRQNPETGVYMKDLPFTLEEWLETTEDGFHARGLRESIAKCKEV